MATTKIETGKTKASGAVETPAGLLKVPELVSLPPLSEEAIRENMKSHLAPGTLMVTSRVKKTLIIEDTQSKCTQEISHGNDFTRFYSRLVSSQAPLEVWDNLESHGLPGNRVALISAKKIRIISSVNGETIYDFDTGFTPDTTLDISNTQVSNDNQYLLVTYTASIEEGTIHISRKKIKTVIKLVELETGTLISIPTKAEIECLTFIDSNRLLALYGKTACTGHEIEIITFDFAAKTTAEQPVELGELSLGVAHERHVYSTCGDTNNKYLVFASYYSGYGSWSLILCELTNNDSVLEYRRTIDSIDREIMGRPSNTPTSLIYVECAASERYVMEFTFDNLSSKLLDTIKGSLGVYSLIFANYQLGLINRLRDQEDRKYSSVTLYDLMSVERYKNRYDKAIAQVIEVKELVPIIRDYANNGFFPIIRPQPTKPKPTTAVLEEIVETTATASVK